MFNTSIFVFITGWILWFFIDKHPASLGVIVPDELDAILDNFQLAFDLLSAGYLQAAFVFIWKAHYIILSIILALLISAIYQSLTNIYRRHRLRRIMMPSKKEANKE